MSINLLLLIICLVVALVFSLVETGVGLSFLILILDTQLSALRFPALKSFAKGSAFRQVRFSFHFLVFFLSYYTIYCSHYMIEYYCC
jgi:hypothetical protein